MRKRKLYKDVVENVKLPKNRKELFKTIFKEDFFLIPSLGMFLLFFTLPLFVVIGLQYILLTSVETISLETIFPIAFYGGLFGIPCFMIAYLAKYAAFFVIKKRAHNDGFILTPALFQGIKENWSKALLSGLLMGAMSMALQVGTIFLLTNFENSIYLGLGVGGLIVLFFVLYMMNEHACIAAPIYTLKWHELLRNGFLLGWLDLFVNLGYFILMIVAPFALSTIHPIAYYIVVFVFMLFITPLLMIVYSLRCHYIFDKCINKEQHPEYVGKGLYKEETKEENV